MGKERILAAVRRRTGLRLHVSERKLGVMRCLDLAGKHVCIACLFCLFNRQSMSPEQSAKSGEVGWVRMEWRCLVTRGPEGRPPHMGQPGR